MANADLTPTQDFNEAYQGVQRASRARATQGPDSRRERIFGEIHRLALERHVAELEHFGYTVVENAAPPEFVARLRARTLEIFDAERGRPVDPERGEKGLFQVMPLMLMQGGEFEQALQNETALALITYLLGESCRISDMHAMLKGPECPKVDLHCDNAFIPEPFPSYAQVANASWLLTDYTRANGALRIVPGSHRLGRHPTSEEVASIEGVPIEAPAGSLCVFQGGTWHGGFVRESPGLRVTLIMYFCRMYLQPHAHYERIIPQEVIDRNPARFAKLIGRHVPWGWQDKLEFAQGMLRLGQLGVNGVRQQLD